MAAVVVCPSGKSPSLPFLKQLTGSDEHRNDHIAQTKYFCRSFAPSSSTFFQSKLIAVNMREREIAH